MELKRSTIYKLCCVYGVVLLCFFITGVCLLSNRDEVSRSRHVVNYTDCIKFDMEVQTCAEYLTQAGGAGASCDCNVEFELVEALRGVVTLYYQLDGYRDTFAGLFESRDPSQWSGVLSATPAAACEPYRYADTSEGLKPIVPCGALADAMFNDTFKLFNPRELLVTVETGLVSEALKAKFRNPSNTNAAVNFAKPINWAKSVWELGGPGADEGGLRSERFIAWMDPELVLKPAARVLHAGGLPADRYKLKVYYQYPPSRYNGSRSVVLEAALVQRADPAPGAALLALSALMLLAGATCYALWRRGLFKITETEPRCEGRTEEEEKSLEDTVH